VNFWDASCIVPLVIEEARSRACRELLRKHRSGMAAWMLTPVEVTSAVRRLEREDRITGRQVKAAFVKLESLRRGWDEVPANDAVIERAMRILALHALTSADALQLAAAVELVGDRPRYHQFVTTDDRLAGAATRTGFDVIVPGG